MGTIAVIFIKSNYGKKIKIRLSEDNILIDVLTELCLLKIFHAITAHLAQMIISSNYWLQTQHSFRRDNAKHKSFLQFLFGKKAVQPKT